MRRRHTFPAALAALAAASLHYVEEHGYLPPDAFIEGVTSGRGAGEGRL
ncbi:DUF7919 family protein [Streptomyces sp. NBC_01808]